MKKIGLFCATVLAGLSLAGCNNLASQSHKASSSSSSTKVVKHHKDHKKANKASHKNKQSSSSSSQATANNNATSQQGNNGNQQATAQSSNGGNDSQQQAQSKSQGEINRERGYDPNGNPLLPGQDHAAGSNPDGSPDSWVQTQEQEEQFDQSHGFIGPDGRFNDAGKAYYHLDDNY